MNQHRAPILLENLLCHKNKNIIEAMAIIDRNSKGIIFITDGDNRFLGTVTDGDVRRGVLSRRSLDFLVEELVNVDPLTASVAESEEIIEQKIKALRPFRDVKIVPILEQGRCVGFYESVPHFFVPISSPSLLGNEINYVHDCVSSGWISSQGSYVSLFEKTFSEQYKSRHSLTVMNATCGLQLALSALGIAAGDEVILPSLTFAASINAIIHTGATPVLVDVREDWCINPDEIRKAITSKTKAIMPVHLYGQVCDMESIMKIASDYRLKVIEDCAEAQGATFKGRAVGTWGDIGCFSFFANKIITTGEGGMNTTQDPIIFEKMKKLRDHGKNLNYIGYFHDEVGFNFRMTNVQAAIGVAQMERVQIFTEDRKTIQKTYERLLSDLPDFVPQSRFQQKNVEPVCWLVSFLLNKKINRDQFVIQLKERGVDVRPFFKPMHQMPIYQKYLSQACPVSEMLGDQGINLPTNSNMDSAIIEKVVQQIKEVLIEMKQ